MNLKEVLERTTNFFKEKKIDSPRLDAEILLSYGLGLKRIDLYLKYDQPIKEGELEKLREIVKRRSLGEPVAYILGEKEFYGETFLVGPQVLIPRPETELLVEKILDWQKLVSVDQPKILDLGCGSGCIGLMLLKKIPEARLFAVDVSADAIELAKKNALQLQVQDRVVWFNGDASQSEKVILEMNRQFNSKIDILVANPPYIDPMDKEVDAHVKQYEPAAALFSEEKGLKYLKEWSTKYVQGLKQKSIVMMEMGYTQAEEVKNHFENLKKFDVIKIEKDLSGKDRFIRGECNG